MLVGLPSTGLHTNGYSLARKVLAHTSLDKPMLDGNGTLGEALLFPHRSYLEPVTDLLAQRVDIKGLAHITGGGFYDNIPRVLPEGLGVKIGKNTWPKPAVFQLIQEIGRIPFEEMYHVFNMGIGMIVVLSPNDASKSLQILAGDSYRIGEVVPVEDHGPRVVIL